MRGPRDPAGRNAWIVVEKRALSRWGCNASGRRVRAGRPGALFSPRRIHTHTHAHTHARGIINICYCTYIRAGRPVSPPPPATGRTLNTLSPCLHMVRAWNRAVESECAAIDPEQWDRAVSLCRLRCANVHHLFYLSINSSSILFQYITTLSPSAFQFSIFIERYQILLLVQTCRGNNSSPLSPSSNPSFSLPDGFEKRAIPPFDGLDSSRGASKNKKNEAASEESSLDIPRDYYSRESKQKSLSLSFSNDSIRSRG